MTEQPVVGNAAARRVSADDGGRAILLLGVGLYSLGLVVTNTYLLSLGVSDFALLRPRYVLTGLAVMSLVAIGWAMPLFIRRPNFARRGWLGHRIDGLEGAVRARLGRQPGSLIASTGAALEYLLFTIPGQLLPIVVYLAFVFATDPGLGLVPALLSALVLWFSGLGASLLAFFVLIRLAGRERDVVQWLRGVGQSQDTAAPESGWQRVSSFAALAVGAVFFAAIHLNSFANRVLPAIPEQFGGTYPREVVLILTESSRWGAPEFGLVDMEGRPVPVSLLFSSESSYVVRAGSTVDVINTDEVAGLVNRH